MSQMTINWSKTKAIFITKRHTEVELLNRWLRSRSSKGIQTIWHYDRSLTLLQRPFDRPEKK